jgi:hypothetical protein
MREDMERNFTSQIQSAREARRTAAQANAEEAALKALGGEPLAGSGFENEEPDAEFSGSDSNQR